MPAKGYVNGSLSHHVGIRLSTEMYNDLKELAEENGTTLAGEIRKAVEIHVMKGSIPSRLNRLERAVFGANRTDIRA